MIANINFTNDLELYLYITDHMVGQFGFKASLLPSGSDLDLPRDWWSVWRCEVLITDPEGRHNVVLFTNAATLVSFICAGIDDDFAGMLKDFEERFFDFMRAKGVQRPEGASITCTTMLNEPEELADNVWWPIDCLKKNLVEGKMEPLAAELKFNMSPASEMGGDSPVDYFTDEFERNSLWSKD
jgi:hypothetical protein